MGGVGVFLLVRVLFVCSRVGFSGLWDIEVLLLVCLAGFGGVGVLLPLGKLSTLLPSYKLFC